KESRGEDQQVGEERGFAGEHAEIAEGAGRPAVRAGAEAKRAGPAVRAGGRAPLSGPLAVDLRGAASRHLCRLASRAGGLSACCGSWRPTLPCVASGRDRRELAALRLIPKKRAPPRSRVVVDRSGKWSPRSHRIREIFRLFLEIGLIVAWTEAVMNRRAVERA